MAAKEKTRWKVQTMSSPKYVLRIQQLVEGLLLGATRIVLFIDCGSDQKRRTRCHAKVSDHNVSELNESDQWAMWYNG